LQTYWINVKINCENNCKLSSKELNIELKYFWETYNNILIDNNSNNNLNVDGINNEIPEIIMNETDKKSNEICNAIFSKNLVMKKKIIDDRRKKKL
jgi:hypothetical protein